MKKNTALLLIDWQQGFDEVSHWGNERNNPNAEKVALSLLAKCRELTLPIFHIRHASTSATSPLNPSKQGFAFKAGFEPQYNEIEIVKNVNSGFIGTDLHTRLKDLGIDNLIVAGLTTDHCVSTTTRMAGNFGYQVYLIMDGCATFDKVGINGEPFDAELIHQTALASLNTEFAQVMTLDTWLNLIS